MDQNGGKELGTMAPNSPDTRIPAALAMLGGALWAASWSFNSFTEDGTRAVLGLSERGWRRLLDPALACLIVALAAYRSRYAWPGSRAAVFGWWTATLGLVAMLVGNVIEFWIGELLYVDVPGQFEPSDHVGWALFLAGLMILSGGFVVLGVVHFRSRLVPGWRRALPLLMGLLPPLVLLLATVAQGAAATLISILVFALGWVMVGVDLWSSARRAA